MTRHCRLCGGETKSIYNFGDFFVSTFIEKIGEHVGKNPLHLVLCETCTLLQLNDTTDMNVMYKQYNYRSGINEKIVNDLGEIARSSGKLGGTWIDIGANDGTLLKYVPRGFKRIGIEPANNTADEIDAEVVIKDFWENVTTDKAEVITAIGMFYDSEDPNLFVKNVKEHLKEGGVFIAQLMTLRPMLDKADLGNICHEHLEYYSYKSLVKLFESNGLEIFKVEENDINGGSYRLYARHLENGSIPYEEPEPDYNLFVKRILENREAVRDFIQQAKHNGEKIYGYGASTKGNTILQFFDLGAYLDGIGDRNQEKIGKLTVGTHIPIVSEEEARLKADYFLILPWGFLDAFVEREKEWHDKGGRFITHTPQFSIL